MQLALREMLSPEQSLALAAGELDFGLLLPPVSEAEGSSTWSCSASASSPRSRRATASRAARGPLAMSELAGESFVMVPREIAPGLYDIVSRARGTRGLLLNVAQEAIQMQTVVSLVSSGLGAAGRAGLGRQPRTTRRRLSPALRPASAARAVARLAPRRDRRRRREFIAQARSLAKPSVLVHPDIDPVAFQIGPLAVRWYGLMYLAGFAAAWWLGMRRIKQGIIPVTRAQFDDILFLVVLGVILGGRLGYVLFYKPDYYFSHPLEIFALWQGGMSFHGGLLGVMAAMTFAAWRHHMPYLQMMDFAAPLVPPGIATGRLGNFINGELWGRVSDVPWAMVFRGAGDAPRHPSQLYQFARRRASRCSSCSGGSPASRVRAARCRRCS